MAGFLESIRAALKNAEYGEEEEQRKAWNLTSHETDDSNNNDDMELSPDRDDMMDSSPPLSPYLSDDDDKDVTPAQIRNLKAENRRLLNVVDTLGSQIQYLRENVRSIEATSEHLTRENDGLREQVVELMYSLEAPMASTPTSPTSPTSPTTHQLDSNNSDGSRRASTPAPQSPKDRANQPDSLPPLRPLPTPKQRKASTHENRTSAVSLQKALTRARTDLARRNTRVRQLEVAYEEKKQNDLYRQARQDWAIDAMERECDGLRKEVGRLRAELARRVAGGGCGDDLTGTGKGGAIEDVSKKYVHKTGSEDEEIGETSPVLTTSPSGSFPDAHSDTEHKLVAAIEALAAAKKEISDKNWKIWRLEQHVDELEMVGFRNERAMDEQKQTIEALKEELSGGKTRGGMADLNLEERKIQDGYRFDLLGETIKMTEEEVEERRTRSI